MTNVARNNPVSRQAWKVDRRWQQVIIRVKYVEHGSREPTAGKSSPCRTSIAKFLLWRRRRRRRRRRISGVVAVGALSYTSGHVDRQGGGREEGVDLETTHSTWSEAGRHQRSELLSSPFVRPSVRSRRLVSSLVLAGRLSAVGRDDP